MGAVDPMRLALKLYQNSSTGLRAVFLIPLNGSILKSRDWSGDTGSESSRTRVFHGVTPESSELIINAYDNANKIFLQIYQTLHIFVMWSWQLQAIGESQTLKHHEEHGTSAKATAECVASLLNLMMLKWLSHLNWSRKNLTKSNAPFPPQTQSVNRIIHAMTCGEFSESATRLLMRGLSKGFLNPSESGHGFIMTLHKFVK